MFTNLLLFLRLMYPYFYVRICSRSTYVFTLGSISISPPAHKMRCKITTKIAYMQILRHFFTSKVELCDDRQPLNHADSVYTHQKRPAPDSGFAFPIRSTRF